MSMFSESLRAFLKPVVPLLDDQDVSEILINGPKEVWVERKGILSRTDVVFTEEGLLAAARNMAQYVGRPLSEERPRLDARLPDGSRIHVVLGPVARKGTTISIRKFFAERLSMQKLVEFGSVTPDLVQLLRAAIELRLNIVVAGGTGSGKTSLLNALSSMIAPHERILTIEDSVELQLGQPHLVSLESRPADRLGKGEINIGDLLHSALRLRPDRIVVGEVRGGECFFLLQAMNTGHGGTLTTAHANTPVDTLRRLEMLCLLSGIEMPLRAVRAQVASAVHLLICCERLSDGKRKITSVAEALPLDEQGEYRTQELYVFEHDEKGPNGEIFGHHVPTGLMPTFFSKLKSHGIDMDPSFFDPEAHGMKPPHIFAQDLGARSQWAKSFRKPVAVTQFPAHPKALQAAPGAVGKHGEPESILALEAEAQLEEVRAQGSDAAAAKAFAPASGDAVRPVSHPELPVPAASSAPAAATPHSAPAAAAPHSATTAPHQLEKPTEEMPAFTAPPASPVATARAALEPIAEEDADESDTKAESTDPGVRAPSPENATRMGAYPVRPPDPVPPAPAPVAPAAPRPPNFAPASSGKVRAPGAVRSTTVPTPLPPEKKRAPAPSLAPSAPAPASPRPVSHSTIQLDPGLAAEISAAMPYESTLITRNPMSRPVLPKRAPVADDEDTNPGIRRPTK